MSTNYVITNGATAGLMTGGAGGCSTSFIGLYDGEHIIASVSGNRAVDAHGNVIAPGFTAYEGGFGRTAYLAALAEAARAEKPCSYCRSGRDPARKTCHTCGAPYDV